MNCKICQAPSDIVGKKHGHLARRDFTLLRCTRCQFAFVADPWLDYAAIYNEDYYAGRGADPLVDYAFELANPKRTIRQYEWSGIVNIVGHLTTLAPQKRWLDFGCGNGGLVRYARENAGCEVMGFEEGAIARSARAAGIPVLEAVQLEKEAAGFDIVTAIEVLEHVADPLAELQRIRRLLRPGGLFFFTTGNALPMHNRILEWSYFVPEIHISLYEPSTMENALRRSGFETRTAGFIPGWENIIAFKVLKNLKFRTSSWYTRVLPWRLLTPIVNWRHGPCDFPVAYAPGETRGR